MPNLGVVLNEEIRRLARKEIKTQLDKTIKSTIQNQKEISRLRKGLDAQLKRIAFLEAQERERISKPTVGEEVVENARFSKQWLKSHRDKLRLSAQDYAKLAGVSMQSVYLWERGSSKPRKEQLGRLVALRGMRRREALTRLKMLENGSRPQTNDKKKRGRPRKAGV